MWTYSIVNYTDLPDTIATHFDGSGNPDGFDSKQSIWLIPSIATVLYIGMVIINNYPHIHNYMVAITEENALKNYRFSTRLLRVVNFLSMLLMAYITYMIIASAHGEKLVMGSWFIPIILGVSIILPIILIIYMKTLNKK
jgi:uncharacterized membrane protein